MWSTRARRLAPWAGLAVFVVALVVQTTTRGLPLSQGRSFLWMALALLAVSVADLRGGLRGVLELAPLYLVTAGYDVVADHSRVLIPRTHITEQLRADEWLGGGTVPTVWLQHQLWSPGHPHWYDYLTWFVYISHFWLPLAVAVVLWTRSRQVYRRYAVALVALWLAAFVTYWAFPAAPPWFAAERGYLPPVARTIPVMWQESGIHVARELAVLAVHYTDPVAAIPSLHAGTPLLIFLVVWRYGRVVRVVSGAYVLAMAVTLVYVGEHYVVDVLIGWAYAALVYAALARWWRRRDARLRPATRSATAEPAYPARTAAPRGVETNATR